MTKRIKLFSEDVYDRLNKDNKLLLDDYVLEMQANGKSEKTIYQYVSDIKAFYCWLYTDQKDEYILDSRKRTFRKFMLQMIENGTSHNRINRFQSSIRNLLEFAAQDDDEYSDYEVNVMKSVKGLEKEPVRDIVFLTDNQVDILIKSLIDKKKYQQALYLSLSYDSAARRNEVLQVKKTDFVNSKHTNLVKGKRGKVFSLLYFNRTREIAKLWLDQRGDDDIDSLWVTTENGVKKPASYQLLYYWVTHFRRILQSETGELIEMNPHSFRHSALENYNNGTHHVLKEMGKQELPLEVLKVLAHHSNISTTQTYLPNKDEEILEQAFA